MKNPDSARLLFELSNALAENPDNPESIELFRRAFTINPSECSSIANPGSNPGVETGERMRARARALIRSGLRGSSVIAALAIGEALCGNEEAVHTLVDYDRFSRLRQITPPEHFEDFHSILADEIRAEMVFYDEPEGRSIRRTWRNNRTTSSHLPASMALTAALRRAVEEYIQDLTGDASHPFVASRPRAFRLEGWAVISDGSGYHGPHIHPNGWMGGVYYVIRPPVSREPGSRRGWLSVGPPELDRADKAALPGWEERFVEPEPGNLVLMPSYFFHRTHPMGVDEERICVAFDVTPTESN
jgi:hypothetical protein